jgi:hypothetical protein
MDIARALDKRDPLSLTSADSDRTNRLTDLLVGVVPNQRLDDGGFA